MSRVISRTFPGRSDQIAHARAIVREAIQDCPLINDAVLLTSELCTNAIQHSRSGAGGNFEVGVYREPGALRIEVRDDGPTGMATCHAPEDRTEKGRGLRIVANLADRWGWYGDESGQTVYFELRCSGTVDQPARKTDVAPAATDQTNTTKRGTAPSGPPSPALRRLFRGLQALDDAIAFRQARLAADCLACTRDRPCDDHGRDVDLIAAYRRDAIALVAAIAESEH